MTQACVQAKGLNMAQGVCDTPVPPVVLRSATLAIDGGKNTYSRFDGLPELRQAIAKKLLQYNGIAADPETDVTVSAGATGAFHCACLALLSPGDEVILFEPYYQYHISALLAVEAVPVRVKMRAPDWTFSSDEVERAITPRTKAIIVNSPGNPSGKVFSRQELESIAVMAQRHDLFVFTDEIYEYFLYDGRTHVSMATLPGMADRTITIGGYSKTFSHTSPPLPLSFSPSHLLSVPLQLQQCELGAIFFVSRCRAGRRGGTGRCRARPCACCGALARASSGPRRGRVAGSWVVACRARRGPGRAACGGAGRPACLGGSLLRPGFGGFASLRFSPRRRAGRAVFFLAATLTGSDWATWGRRFRKKYHRLAHRLQCRIGTVGTGDRRHERLALCLCPDAVAGGSGGGHPGTSWFVLSRARTRLSAETRSVLPGLGPCRSDRLRFHRVRTMCWPMRRACLA